MPYIPHGNSPVEIRRAFQQMEQSYGILDDGTSGQLLVGVAVDTTAEWVDQNTVDHGGFGGLGDDDHAQYHNDARGDARYYTETELDGGQLDNRYFTESEHIDTSAGAGDAGKPVKLDAGGHIDATMLNDGDIDHGGLTGLADDDHTQYHNDARGDARYYTETELDGGQLDARYYTETELDGGQLDTRYYTETELDGGQLDARYFTESEHLDVSAGAGDAGKPVKLDADGHIDATMLNDGDIDHGSLSGLGDDDHAQYHNDARGDARYYTETELDGGQLDTRYYTESEHIDASAGAGDAGKPVVLNADGEIDATMYDAGGGGVTDHGDLTGLADDDHTQYHNDARGDARYYLQSEHIDSSVGDADSGKPIKLNSDGLVDPTMAPTVEQNVFEGGGSIGVNWVKNSEDVDTYRVACFANLTKGIVLAGTTRTGKILRSTDYGKTWTDLGQQFSQTRIWSLAYFGSGIAIAGTSPDGKILRSTDYGETWVDLGQVDPGSGDTWSLSAHGSGLGFAGTATATYRTLDYGATWADVEYGGAVARYAAALNGAYVFMGTSSGVIHRSINGGGDWHTANTPTMSVIHSLETMEDGVVVAGGYDGDGPAILRSYDDGVHWSKRSIDTHDSITPSSVRSLAFLGNGICIGAADGDAWNAGTIIRTEDNAWNWYIVDPPGGIDGSAYSAVYAGEGVALAGTGDSARIWRSTSTVLPSQVAQIISQDTTIYVETTGDDIDGAGTSDNPFQTVGRAVEYLRDFVINNAAVTIQVGDGTFNHTSDLELDHINGSLIKITGTNTYAKTITGVVAATEYADYWIVQLDVDDVSNVTSSDYLKISHDVSGGTHPEKLPGIWQITVVGIDPNRISVKIPSHWAAAPSGAVSGTATAIKTRLSFDAGYGVVVPVAGSIGSLDKLAIIGTGSGKGLQVQDNANANTGSAFGVNGFAYGIHTSLGSTGNFAYIASSNNENEHAHIEGSRFTMSYAALSGGNDRGILVTNGSQCKMLGAIVNGNAGIGIFGDTGSQINFYTGSSCDNLNHGVFLGGVTFAGKNADYNRNGGKGVFVQVNTGCQLNDSVIDSNAGDGVRPAFESPTDLRDATVTNNGGVGINAYGNTFVDATGATVSGNGTNYSPALNTVGNQESLIVG